MRTGHIIRIQGCDSSPSIFGLCLSFGQEAFRPPLSKLRLFLSHVEVQRPNLMLPFVQLCRLTLGRSRLQECKNGDIVTKHKDKKSKFSPIRVRYTCVAIDKTLMITKIMHELSFNSNPINRSCSTKKNA